MKLPIEEKVEVPSGVTATFSEGIVSIKGPKGEVSRDITHPKVDVSLSDGVLRMYCEVGTKREKNFMFTIRRHIQNMVRGVQEPYVYKLKVCSGHFPMTVAVAGENLEVKNFLGEKSPRKLRLKKGATVKVNGPNITVESANVEIAGNIASDIERLMYKGTRDARIFQDGIYIIEKPMRVRE